MAPSGFSRATDFDCPVLDTLFLAGLAVGADLPLAVATMTYRSVMPRSWIRLTNPVSARRLVTMRAAR
jgi:hypothetical protein